MIRGSTGILPLVLYHKLGGGSLKDLLKNIREKTQLSQRDFGAELGVSFSTVNRWENGKTYPNKMAQLRLYDLARKYNVDVTEMIYEKIRRESDSIELEEERVLLYHGSKSGIEGKIRPISRARCDFGRGFYMGTVPEQPLTLICDYDNSKFYIVSIGINNLFSLEIEPNIDWAMFVAYNRGRLDEIKGSNFYKKYEEYSKCADIIIGNIANDRMFFVLDNFFQGNVTDEALIGSISALKLGKQYVAVTEKACSCIRIEKEVELSFLERKCLREISEINRSKGVSMANQICREHRRDGLFFDEILSGRREES